MQQFNFRNNTLNLKVKKSPLAVRIVMFFFAFAFFIFPLVGTIVSVLIGGGLQIGYFIWIGIFGLMGFYLLRVSLWNTYGEENIEILNNKIIYEASYGWFKDGKKETLISDPNYHAIPAGYIEDNEGVLVIASENTEIQSVVKMKIPQLEELVSILATSKI